MSGISKNLLKVLHLINQAALKQGNVNKFYQVFLFQVYNSVGFEKGKKCQTTAGCSF